MSLRSGARSRASLCRVIEAIVTVLLAGAGFPAFAVEEHQFNIPDEDATAAIHDFSTQAQVQIVVAGEGVKDKRLHGVNGEYSTDQGLRILLADSGLAPQYVGDRAIALVATSGDVSAPSPKRLLMLAQTGQNSGAATMTSTYQTSSGAEGQDQLGEVIVTAQRREEALSKVPISITALTQRYMDDYHIENMRDLSVTVPGLDVASNNPTNQDQGGYAIRGIGGGGGALLNQIYIDETPISIRGLADANSSSPYPNIFDLDRVEVLRGPQGTLFGAAAMGGAIRFITPQPNLTESSGTMKADLGFTKDGAPNYELGAAYGDPVVPGSLGFRVSAWYQSNGGWIDRVDPSTGQVLDRNANSSEAYVVRPAFTWAPVDGLSITPAFYLESKHSQNPDSYWVGYASNEGSGPVWGGIAQPATDDLRLPSLAIKYSVGNLTAVSDTSYLYRQFDGIDDFTHTVEYYLANSPFIPGFNNFAIWQNDIATTRAFQQEFRLSSDDPSSRVKWVTGLYYRRAAQRLMQIEPPDLTPLTEALYGLTSAEAFGGHQNYVYDGQVLNAFSDVDAVDVSEAAFADVTVELASRLKAGAGVRVEHSEVYGQTEFLAGPLNGYTTDSARLEDESQNPVTPRFDLSYLYSDTGMAYFNASKGYRPGGGNSPDVVGNPNCDKSLKLLGIGSVPAAYQSDSLWNYELGVKDFLMDRRLSIQGSIYYIVWSNMQSGVSLPSCFNTFVNNQGKAISKGFDLQVEALVTDHLRMRFLGGYTDAYYPNAYIGLPNPGSPPPVLNVAGEKLDGVIPWTAVIQAQYSHDLSGIWSSSQGYLRGDYRWQSNSTTQNASDTGYDPAVSGIPADPRSSVLNLRVGVTHGGLDLSAYVNNATNSNPVLHYFHGAEGEDLYFAGMRRPLTAGLTAWYRF